MRILLVTDNFSDGIAFYRSVGPWNDIQKDYDDIIVTRILAKDYFGWELITAHDLVFISNPRQVKHLDIIRGAKNYGIKVWADYDDCYLDIPEENQSFNILTAGHVNQMTKECLINSDIITVTTNYLKEVFLPYNTNIRVIPNAFPLEYLNDRSLGEMKQGHHNFISWRGSNSHEVNLLEYADEIKEISTSNPDWMFKFCGMKPKFFRGMNYTHHDFVQLYDSFYRLKMFASKLHIVTLYDRPFNKSKSNISWIEATISGSVVLAPDWEEWKKPGIVNYASKEDFKEKLQALINGEYNLTELFEQSRDYILNNLSLKKVNRDRLKILYELRVTQSNYGSRSLNN
jgi:hypothetical protein